MGFPRAVEGHFSSRTMWSPTRPSCTAYLSVKPKRHYSVNSWVPILPNADGYLGVKNNRTNYSRSRHLPYRSVNHGTLILMRSDPPVAPNSGNQPTKSIMRPGASVREPSLVFSHSRINIPKALSQYKDHHQYCQ